jgi:hypothetical protein
LTPKLTCAKLALKVEVLMKDKRTVVMMDQRQYDWILAQTADRNCSVGQVIRDALYDAQKKTDGGTR